MAKNVGEHGDNLERTAHFWRLPHVPAIAAEFGDTAVWGSEKHFPQMVSVYELAVLNDLEPSGHLSARAAPIFERVG